MAKGAVESSLHGMGLAVADIARLANSGSYSKGVSLLSAGAVKATVDGASGLVKVSVQSERTKGIYEVRTEYTSLGEARATCSCCDFRRRGGMCKHGAAALLHLIAERHPSMATPTGNTTSPQKRLRSADDDDERGIATPARSDMLNRLVKKRVLDISTRVSTADEKHIWATPCEECASSVPKPSFPRAAAVPIAPAVSNVGGPQAAKSNDQKKRSHGLKAAMAMRLLKSHAAAGNAAAFASELGRWTGPLDDVEGLLHCGALCVDVCGAVAITDLLLDRPEACGALSNAHGLNGRTLLHAAVVSQRLDLCAMLLRRGADVHIQDASGLTALDLAKKKKLDVSAGRLEDPFVVMLRDHITFSS